MMQEIPGGQNSLLTNLNPPNVIGCRHFQDGLNGLAIVVTTVTAWTGLPLQVPTVSKMDWMKFSR